MHIHKSDHCMHRFPLQKCPLLNSQTSLSSEKQFTVWDLWALAHGLVSPLDPSHCYPLFRFLSKTCQQECNFFQSECTNPSMDEPLQNRQQCLWKQIFWVREELFSGLDYNPSWKRTFRATMFTSNYKSPQFFFQVQELQTLARSPPTTRILNILNVQPQGEDILQQSWSKTLEKNNKIK